MAWSTAAVSSPLSCTAFRPYSDSGRGNACHDEADGGRLQALRLRRPAGAEEDRNGHRHGDADDDAEIFHETLLVGV